MRNRITLGMIVFACFIFSDTAQGEDVDSDPPPKNVQLLKGISKTELSQTMNFIRASLGVHCDFCHVVGKDKWNWASDEKAQKKKAREMIQMVLDINRSSFKGEANVTCFTCHQGQIRPNGLPPLPQKSPAFPTVVPDSGVVQVAPAEIVERYIQASGGPLRSSITNAKTLILKGTTDETWKRKIVPIEIYFKAPDKWLITLLGEKDTFTQGYDGAKGWIHDGSKAWVMSNTEVAMFRDTLESLQLLPSPTSSAQTTVRKVEIEQRPVYALENSMADGGSECFYFDAQTNLLMKKSRLTKSPIGMIPQEFDYENYKDLQGAKVPYTLRSEYVDPWIGGTRSFSDIQVDAPLEDSKFQMPSTKP